MGTGYGCATVPNTTEMVVTAAEPGLVPVLEVDPQADPGKAPPPPRHRNPGVGKPAKMPRWKTGDHDYPEPFLPCRPERPLLGGRPTTDAILFHGRMADFHERKLDPAACPASSWMFQRGQGRNRYSGTPAGG